MNLSGRHAITALTKGALALIMLAGTAPFAAAQTPPTHELWNPELIICGPLAPNVYVKNGTAAQQGACTTVSLGAPSYVPVFTPPDSTISLGFPNDFAENPNTLDLLVSDTLNSRVLIFGADGTPKGQLGGANSPFSHFNSGTASGPFGAVADVDGNILVADPGVNKIFLFDKTGAPLAALPSVLSCVNDPALGFSQPWRIALEPGTSITPGHEHGKVYVVEEDPNHRVSICDAAWNYLGSAGSGEGSDPGQLESATGVALDQAGRIYVADGTYNQRVQVFDSLTGVTSGTPLSLLQIIDTTVISGLKDPYGVALDANGRVLIADASSNAMWVLGAYVNGGNPLTQFPLLAVEIGSRSGGNCDIPAIAGPPADGPGVLRCPANINLDSTGRLLVADPLNDRVQRFNHPLMTTTLVNGGASVVPGQPITVQVTVQAAFGKFGKVIPVVTPSNAGLVVISSSPQSPTLSPDGNLVSVANACTAANDPTIVAAGAPVTFTFVYQSTGAQGPLFFTAYATALDCLNGKALVSAQDGSGTSDSIAVGTSSGSVSPTTTVAVTGTQGFNGWYIGPRPPTATLTFTATGSPTPNEIDVSFGAQVPPTGTSPVCQGVTTVDAGGRHCTVTLPQAGPTQVWYRSKNSDGLSEPWSNNIIVKYDGGVPILSPVLTPAANAHGWNNTDVTVGFSVTRSDAPLCGTDATSCPGAHSTDPNTPPSPPAVDPASVVVTGVGANLTVPTLWVCDIAGRCNSTNPVVKIDRTPPTIASFLLQPAANAAGWNHTSVVVTFTGADTLSGFAPGTSTFSPAAFTTEGANQSVIAGPGTFTDLAGNVNTDNKTAIFNIDMTPPTVTPTFKNAAGTVIAVPATGWFNVSTGTPTLTFIVTDSLSGISGAATQNNFTIAQGTQSFTSQVFTDVAGNTNTGSATVKVDTVAPTASGLSIVPPAGVVLNALGFYDLTLLPAAFITVNVTASDAASGSGVQQVCYDPTGGSTCSIQATLAGTAYSVTVGTAGTTTGSLWVVDNAGNPSAHQTFTIKITRSPNQAPSFTKGPDPTVLEDSGAKTVTNWATNLSAGPASDAGQALSFIVSNNNPALFSAQPAIAANGTLTFTPAATANGSATVTVQIHDDGGTGNGGVDTSAVQTFVINVTPVNDQPTVTLGANLSVKQNIGAQTLMNWATNITAGSANEASQTLTFTVTNSNNALFTVQPSIAANGTLTFTPSTTATGTATVTVKLQDNGGTANNGVDTLTQTFTITTTASNRPPVAVADTSSTPTATAIALNVLANDSDPDGNALTLKSVTSPSAKGGTVVIKDGRALYTPPASLTRGSTDTFSYTVSDTAGATATATVTVTILNAAPVAKADTASTFKGESLNINVLTNDTDADPDTLTITKTTNPSHGSVYIYSNGSIKYTPSSSFTGTDSFTYTVSDGHGGTATATVTVTTRAHSNGDGCDHNNHDGHHEHNYDGNDHGDHECNENDGGHDGHH